MKDKKIRLKFPPKVSFLDYPDPEKHCVSIYTVGCNHYCADCCNPQLQKDDKEGEVIDYFLFEKELKDFCKRNKANSIVLLGGDCLYEKNIEFTKLFLKRNSKKYNICLYTGYEIDYVIQNKIEGFKYIKCGKYNIVQKQISSKTDTEFILASKNQKLYNSNYQLLSKDGVYKF